MECVAGRFGGNAVGDGGAKRCVTCAAGKASIAGSGQCLSCPSGRWASPPQDSFACVLPANCTCTEVFLSSTVGAWCHVSLPSALVSLPSPGGGAAEHGARGRLVARLPCLLADGKAIAPLQPGLPDTDTNAFAAPQRHGTKCVALARLPNGRSPCSIVKCKPWERFGDWSECSRKCGGGWRKRSWTKTTCTDFTDPRGFSCKSCRSSTNNQIQSRRCSPNPCPCTHPPPPPRIFKPLEASWKSWLLRKMKKYGVYIAGAKRCSESREQLRLCHHGGSDDGAGGAGGDGDGYSDDETAEDACQVLKDQFRECGGGTQAEDPDPACLVPDQLPSIVWLPPPQPGTGTSTPHKPMAWAGFHDWADLKAVLDKVDDISNVKAR